MTRKGDSERRLGSHLPRAVVCQTWAISSSLSTWLIAVDYYSGLLRRIIAVAGCGGFLQWLIAVTAGAHCGRRHSAYCGGIILRRLEAADY